MKTLFIYIENVQSPLQAQLNNNPTCTVTGYAQWQNQTDKTKVCYVEHIGSAETKQGNNDDLMYLMAISG